MSRYVRLSEFFPKGFNVDEAAESLSIPMATFRSYLYGTRRPQPETAKQIQDFLMDNYGVRVDLEDLLLKRVSA